MYAEEETLFWVHCFGLNLMAPSWPYFKHRLTVEDVELVNCSNYYGASYADTMAQLNVTFTKRLRLTNVPDVELTQAAFKNLPSTVEELTIAKDSGLLNLTKDAWSNVKNIKKLVLKRVKPYMVPGSLRELDMTDTGLNSPSELLFRIPNLQLSEPQIRVINASVPKLQYFKLSNVQMLKSVTLRNASTELLQDGHTDWSSYVKVLEFSQSSALQLNAGLLSTAPSLVYFAFKQGKITTVPQNFFVNNKHLQIIDLSYNNLESFPSNLFSELSNLHTLLLEENCFTKRGLGASWQISSLKVLSLQGNHLGDFCDILESSKSSLPKLQDLNLARTNAVSVCSNLLRAIPSLRYLDLRNNNMSSISCAHLARTDKQITVIDVVDNPVKKIDCKDRGDGNIEGRQGTLLLTESNFDCTSNCPHALCLSANLLTHQK